MKQFISHSLFLLLFFCTQSFNISLFAQDRDGELKREESFQRYDSLEREMLLARKPLLAFGYNNLKVFGGSRGCAMGYVSFNYLPTGLPGISETNTPLLQPSFGYGVKIFLGNILGNFTIDDSRTAWQMSPQAPIETMQLASFNMNTDLGYAVWKSENFLLTPCASIGFSRYTFDTNYSRKKYTLRNHLGGAIDMSYFVPLLDSPFHSLEQRKLGIQEIIEAMISVRLGYAQHFENGFTTPTHQEFSLRVMVGISTHKFVED